MAKETLDFGFTAVDQDELVTKTGESAALNEKIADDLKKVAESSAGSVRGEQIEVLDGKIDVLTKVVSNALDELEEAKVSSGSSTDVAVSKLKSSLAEAEELILPLLYKLMENEDKEYIYWPNRTAIITGHIERVKKVTRG